jgi:serine/threonine protein kinase
MSGLLAWSFTFSYAGDRHSNRSPIGLHLSLSVSLTHSLSTSLHRDILEKSARGDYSIEGKEWDGISADAKDLVRRMLTVDPEKRITTGGSPDPHTHPPSPSLLIEILAHPWICMVNEEALPGTATPQRDQLARRQSATNTNLNSALRALSNHVHEQRFEKMATNFTRLVSILQQNSGEKLVKYLNHPDDTGEDSTDDSSAMSPILSLEIRDALINVFKELGS